MTESWRTSHFFYFADPVQQAEFERGMIGDVFTLTTSHKTDWREDEYVYLTTLERRESVDETIEEALALHDTLREHAEAYHGKYSGHETEIPMEEDEMVAFEEFVAALPKQQAH